GVPLPGLIIRIAPLDGSPGILPPGERGEVCIAGPNITAGYWKRPDATAEARTEDGFLRTGDVGYMDEEGWVYIVDRTKDMILCSGYNVYPRVIEEAIYEHPDVEEVAGRGLDDPWRGQAPKVLLLPTAQASALRFEGPPGVLGGQHEKRDPLAAT